MSGINPYIEKQEFELPKVNYRITFLPMGKNVEGLFDEIPEEGGPRRIGSTFATGFDGTEG